MYEYQWINPRGVYDGLKSVCEGPLYYDNDLNLNPNEDILRSIITPKVREVTLAGVIVSHHHGNAGIVRIEHGEADFRLNSLVPYEAIQLTLHSPKRLAKESNSKTLPSSIVTVVALEQLEFHQHLQNNVDFIEDNTDKPVIVRQDYALFSFFKKNFRFERKTHFREIPMEWFLSYELAKSEQTHEVTNARIPMA